MGPPPAKRKKRQSHSHPVGVFLGSGAQRSGLCRYADFGAGGFLGRWAITSRRENKTPKSTPDPLGRSWAPALNALASRNIQDDCLFAVPAIDREIFRHGVIHDAEQVAISPAHWAGDPAILHVDFTIMHDLLQPPFENVSK